MNAEQNLPITIALAHVQLGVDEESVCGACARGDHWDCNLATWCQCESDCDGVLECDDFPMDTSYSELDTDE